MPGDPLGILAPKQGAQTSDPLGILNGTPKYDTKPDIRGVMARFGVAPEQTEQQSVTNYGNKVQKAQLQKRDDAISNTIAYRNDKLKVPTDTTSLTYKNDVQKLKDKLYNNDVALAKGKDGKDYLVPTSGFLESAGNSLIQSVKDPVEAWSINTKDGKDLANFIEKKNSNQPFLPESVPSPIAGAFGEAAGSFPKIAALFGLNEVAPGLGTTMAAAEAQWTSTAKQTERLYYDRLKQLQDKGVPLEQARVQAANDAKKDAPLVAAPDAITTAMLGEMGVNAGKLDAATNSFKNELVKTAKSSAKFYGIGATAEAARSGIEKAQGYDVTLSQMMENATKGGSQWAIMDGMFKIMPLAKSMTGSLRASYLNYMSQLPKEVVSKVAAENGEQGQQFMQDLNNYEQAKNKVEGLVPEEALPNFAGLTEKQDKVKAEILDLQAKKATIPKGLHEAIDKEIVLKQGEADAIDEQLSKMLKSKDPSKLDIDRVTGNPEIEPEILQENASETKEEKSPEVLPEQTNEGTASSNEPIPSKEESIVDAEVNKGGEGTEDKRFTEGKDLNEIYANLKSKYGDKKGAALYEVANRLVNPNQNKIIEIRSNGVVVKEGEKYLLKPFGNTDANPKKWTLYKGLDVTDQFAPKQEPPTENIQPKEQPIEPQAEIKPPTEEEIPPTTPPIEPPIEQQPLPESEDGKTTSIKNAVTKEERAQQGMPEVEVLARRKFGDVFDKGKELVDSGKIDPILLAKQLETKPRPLTPEESVALLYSRMKLHNEFDEVHKQLAEAYKNGDKEKQLELSVRKAKLQDDMNSNDIAARRTGYEQGLGLAIRKLMIKQDYTLANQMQQFRNANGGEEIPKEVAQKLEGLTAKLDEAMKKLEEYEKRISELEAQKNIPKGKKGSRSKDEIKKEREDIFKKIGDKWKGAGKDTLSSDIPYRQQLVAIAPEVVKLIANYAEEGIIKLSEIVDDIHSKLSPIIPEITKKDVTDILAGEYTEKKSKSPLTPEKMKLQANIEKIKDQIDLEKLKLEQARRTNFQKGLDWFAKFRRAVILSSVQTLGKLTSAATYRQLTNTIEEVVGAGLSKIPGISKIAEGAPREGGISMKAEAKSLSQWWQKATFEDVAQTVKTGKSELDYLYGTKKDMPKSTLDFIGQIHGALKVPAKRAEFFRSFEKRSEHAQRIGKNIDDPIVQSELLAASYVDANRSIFMNDNKLTNAYQRLVGYFEHEAGNVGKATSTALKVLLPIVKIPTNYVSEALSYAGGYAKALPLIGKGIYKGLESITPEEKDYVMRNLKKGSVGAAIFALGYFNPQAVGGYYTGKRNEQDLTAGDLKLFGVSLPHFLLHAPILEVLQMGSTLRRVQDDYAVKEKPGGTAAGISGIVKGTLEEVPFFSTTTGISQATESPRGTSKYVGDLAKSILVPPDVQRIARAQDVDEKGNPVYRKPENIIQDVESGMPGLRKNVPIHPIRQTQDKTNKVWDILTAKGLDLPKLNRNSVKPKDIDGNIVKLTDKQFAQLADLREQKIMEKLQYEIDNNNAKKLNREQLKQLMKSIEQSATDEAESELFNQ